jgi:hypothetical protein
MCGGLRNLAKPYCDVIWPSPTVTLPAWIAGEPRLHTPCFVANRAMPPEDQPSPTGATGVSVMPIALGDRVRGHAILRLRPVLPV